jgi:putative peptidoglycan lipid II flippase
MAKKRFLMPALAPLVYNISIIIFGLLFSKYGIIGFSVGALIGSFLGPFLIQFLALRKEIHFKLSFNFLDKDFLNFLKISIPIMAGLILISLDDWISKFYGSKLPDGTITYLNNSRRLIMVPIGVFAQANAQAILPFLSEFFSKREFEKFNQLIRKSTTLVFFITSFAASWYIVFYNEIIRMVYQRGKFLEVNSIENSKIFLMFAFAIPFWAGVTIVSRFYYSMKNTLIPMIIGAVMLMMSIPFFIILPKYMDAPGLALTISITKFLYFITIFFVFKTVFKEFKIKILFLDIAKIIIFFITITTSFFFIKRYVKINWFVLLTIGSSIQFIITLFLAKFLKLDAYQEFFNRYLLRIIRKIKR